MRASRRRANDPPRLATTELPPRRNTSTRAASYGSIRSTNARFTMWRRWTRKKFTSEGLEEVVDGSKLERLDGVVAMRGGENDVRLLGHAIEDGEPAEAGQGDIEKKEIGTLALDLRDGGRRVGGDVNDDRGG